MSTKKRQKQLKKQKQRKALRYKKEPLIKHPSNPMENIPEINYKGWVDAIKNRDESVWEAIIEYLLFFEHHHYKAFGAQAVKSMTEFAQLVYTAMLDEGFTPNRQMAFKLIQTSHLFHHIVAITGFRSNDGALKGSLLQENNVAKVLFLQNPRCELQVKQADLFAVDPFLTSVWFNTYILGISSPTRLLQENLYKHFRDMDERWIPPHHALSGIYFSCTYHCPDHVRHVKSIMNARIKEKGLPEFNNNPSPDSIAIVTNKWHRNHAVYKSASPLVEQLVGKYKLTLVWTAPKDRMPDTIVTDYFDKVVNCHFERDGKLIIPDELKNNDFQLVYFPDIGMTDESIWLSNARMAPIQAVGYGHPDTTGDNNEIDYYICGQVEKEADQAYSETRVCIPGLAQEPAWPTAERKHNYIDDGVVRVNCVWGPDKYNHSLLMLLNQINKSVWGAKPDSKHEFHLFASPGINRYAALPSFCEEIRRMLPNAVLHSEQEYYDYMENAEQHDFALNSFPFGCYNVLVESLYMGLPFITLVGNRFYNRAGAWLNDQVDMGCNNCDNPQEYVNKSAQLILFPDKLKGQREHLASIDLKEKLFSLKGTHFLEAIEHIIANHPFEETKLIGEEDAE
jgi:hypothetical protein